LIHAGTAWSHSRRVSARFRGLLGIAKFSRSLAACSVAVEMSEFC
jgi:hypothetical protein